MDVTRTSPALTRAQKLTVVTLEEAKAHLRIRHSDEDLLIGDQIEAAFDFLHGENGWLNGYCLLREEFTFYPEAPAGAIELPLRPALQVETSTFGRRPFAAEDYVAFGPGDFVGVRQGDVGMIARLTAVGFESRFGVPDPRQYRITFTAGHETAADVPTPLKQAIKMLAGHYYRNREATEMSSSALPTPVVFGLTSLAGRYRFSPDHS